MRLLAVASVFKRTQGLSVAALLASLSGAVAASGCDPPALGALAGVERSRWEEFDAQGKSLVRERGTLKTAGLLASGRCDVLDWTAQWSRSQGERGYDGLTTKQQPFQTQSQLRAQALTLAGWLPATDNWAVGAQFSYRQIQRDIVSKVNVLGYPEQFNYLQAAVGARYRAALANGVQLTVSSWVGAGPGGQVLVDFPRADPVTLPLGRSRLLALSVQLGGGEIVQTGWSWQAGVDYRQEQTNAGLPQVISRNGVIVGAALQPRVVQRHLGTTAVMNYRF